MKPLVMMVLAAALAALLGGPALAQPLTPEGVWETEDGKNRYRVEVCGPQTELCAYVYWVRPDLRTERLDRLIGHPIFEQLPLVGTLRWRGPVKLGETEVTGVVEVISADELHVKACKFILCYTLKMSRIES
jgi:hypothetical protein